MKKGVLITTAGVFLLFFFCSMAFVSLVSAASKDVGYILLNSRSANPQIISVFNEFNLTYDLLLDSKASTWKNSLSNYRFLFIDDVRLNNARSLAIYNYPSVIMNKYYGPNWGLTDRDGISQMTSTSPLTVKLVDNGFSQVYTDSRTGLGGSFIPLYYLSDENRVSGTSIARSFEGGGDSYNTPIEYGNVIEGVPAGTLLENGKTSQANMCFFGIAKTKYWTDDARELFKDCVGYVGVKCSNDSDCPSQPEGNRYCYDNDVYQNIAQFHCENPGTVKSQCVNGAAPEMKEDCDDHNASTEDICAQTLNNAACQHKLIRCFDDGDCPGAFYDNPFCSDSKSLSINYTYFTCENKGTSNSSCNKNKITQLNQTCLISCLNNGCVECYKDSDCDDDNRNTEDKCIGYKCRHNPIICFADTDCGINSLSDIFCASNGRDILKSWLNFTCLDNGTSSSSCINRSGTYNMQTCPNSCSFGQCIRCSNDFDCDDHDSYTLDICLKPGSPQSSCENTPINCFNDSDCSDFSGLARDDYCENDDVFIVQKTATCLYNGTVMSNCFKQSSTVLKRDCGESYCENYSGDYCKDNNDLYKLRTCYDKGCDPSFNGCFNFSRFEEAKSRECEYGCSGNSCNPQCTLTDLSRCGSASSYIMCSGKNLINVTFVPACKNGTCGMNNTNYTIRNCLIGCENNACLPEIHDVGILNSIGVNGISILLNNSDVFGDILKGAQYKIRFETRNNGNFTENLTFSTSSLCFSWTPTKRDDLNPGEITSRTSLLLTFNCLGNQNIATTANLTTAIDENPLDNIRTRQFKVVECLENSHCGSSTSYLNCSGSNVVNITAIPTCSNGLCINNGTSNSTVEDCGDDSYSNYGANYCKNNAVYKNRTFFDKGCLSNSCFANSVFQEVNVENCTDVCENGICGKITCHNNSECGTDVFIGLPFCSDSKTIGQNYITFTCVNPGKINSYCTNSTINKNVGSCLFGCSNGGCTC